MAQFVSGCSVARLARHAGGVEVGGSNPLTPTRQILLNVSSKGFFVSSPLKACFYKGTKQKIIKCASIFKDLSYVLPMEDHRLEGGNPSIGLALKVVVFVFVKLSIVKIRFEI